MARKQAEAGPKRPERRWGELKQSALGLVVSATPGEAVFLCACWLQRFTPKTLNSTHFFSKTECKEETNPVRSGHVVIKVQELIDSGFFSHSIMVNNLFKNKILTTQVPEQAINSRNGMFRPSYMEATAKPRTHSWKIEPSKEGLWIPSLTKEEMELGGFRGVSMSQCGISDALYTSPSRLVHRPSIEHASSECLSQHTALHWMETAAGPGVWADTVPGPLEPVQCGVTKECRNCGFGSCTLINVVKQRKVCMFFRPYAEGMSL